MKQSKIRNSSSSNSEGIPSSNIYAGAVIGDDYLSMIIARFDCKGNIYPYEYERIPLATRREHTPSMPELLQALRECWSKVGKYYDPSCMSFSLCLPSWNLSSYEYTHEIPIEESPTHDTLSLVEIRKNDVQRLHDSLCRNRIQNHYIAVDIIPRYYEVDNGRKVINPIGLPARKLSLNAHVVLSDIGTIQGILNCLKQLEIRVDHLVSPFSACAEATLLNKELSDGVILIDLGYTNTCCGFYYNGIILGSLIIPQGQDHILGHISRSLQSSRRSLRIEFARFSQSILFEGLTSTDLNISLSGGEGDVPLQVVEQEAETSIEDILGWAVQSYIRSMKERYRDVELSQIVFVGEDYLTLRTIVDLAKKNYRVSARVGFPTNILSDNGINKPYYSRTVGTLRYAANNSINNYYLKEYYATPSHRIAGQFRYSILCKLRAYMNRLFPP